jgi:hypothetical protein
LLELLSVLPGHIIVPLEDRVVLCSKFFDYHALDPDSVPAYEKGDRVDAFWVAIQRLKDPATGKQLYPNLCKLVMHVLLLLHRNSFCETLFSIVKKMITDMRSQLGRGKEGHASDSVYKDVHGVKNTLCGLLTSKINVFKGTNCHEWKPTGDLLASCKSATYQAPDY